MTEVGDDARQAQHQRGRQELLHYQVRQAQGRRRAGGRRSSSCSAASSSTGGGERLQRPAARPPAAALRAGRGVVVDRSTNTLIFLASPDEYSQITLAAADAGPARQGRADRSDGRRVQLDDNMPVRRRVGTARHVLERRQLRRRHARRAGHRHGRLHLSACSTAPRGVRVHSMRWPRTTGPRSCRARACWHATARRQPSRWARKCRSSPASRARYGLERRARTTGVLQTIQYRNTGVILKVKPVIHSGDQIDLDVTQEVSAAADDHDRRQRVADLHHAQGGDQADPAQWRDGACSAA